MKIYWNDCGFNVVGIKARDLKKALRILNSLDQPWGVGRLEGNIGSLVGHVATEIRRVGLEVEVLHTEKMS